MNQEKIKKAREEFNSKLMALVDLYESKICPSHMIQALEGAKMIPISNHVREDIKTMIADNK